MRRSDFDYELPARLIAQAPLPERSAGRLLCVDGESGAIRDRMFAELPELLEAGDLMVFNDTRVIPARLHGRKDTGGRVEALVERVLSERRALVHLRASRAPREGSRLWFGDAGAEIAGRREELFELDFDEPVLAVLERAGHVPLPPYIERADTETDRERYQTVFARRPGAAAAPTAGLHFDEALLARLDEMGVARAFTTLHVGAGTFRPVREERVEDHAMHAERVEVSRDLCAAVEAARARGGRVVAVGTTAVRALESAARDGNLAPFSGETDIFIYPGYRFRVVDALITNFHLPESTLLMLVCAFGGYHAVMSAYRHAVAREYRFFSYGDAMYLTPHPAARGAAVAPDLPPSAEED